MKPLSASQKRKIARFLKHPLLITLVGSLVASALIPWIVGRSNARAVLAKTRIDQALEMMNASASVDTLLNEMKTAFEAFEKDSLRAFIDRDVRSYAIRYILFTAISTALRGLGPGPFLIGRKF